MSQYTFIKRRDPDNKFDGINITFDFDAVTLEEMHEAYVDFLAACAFQVQGMEFRLEKEEE